MMKDEDRPAGALTRRDLMRAGAIGSALAAAGPLLTHAAGAAQAAEPAPGATPSGATPFELEETTIAALQEGMKSGRHTARPIVKAYLGRIEELNRKGPELRAVIETNPEALDIASTLDTERKAKGPRGPLHGIPVLLKDVDQRFVDAGLAYLRVSDSELLGRIEREPKLLRLPFVRSGSRISIGQDEAAWKEMAAA